MAIFSVEIADEDVDRVINAICENYGWQEEIVNPINNIAIPNPENKSVFANRMVREFLKDHVVKYETDKAIKEIRNSININPTIKDPQV